jgi:formiminotetrahydrofolate cyclodeaminase
MGAALCAMVSRLTLAREKYLEAWTTMELVRDKAESLAERLLLLMDEDTLAYNGVVAALKMPKETPAEKSARRTALQQAYRRAAAVPLHTLRAAADLADLARAAVEKGNPHCITDAGTAAQLARASAVAAAYNVRVNLAGISEQAFVDQCTRDVSEIVARVTSIVGDLEEKVASSLA